MKVLNNKKNYYFTLSSSFLSLIISIVLNLISVPISLKYWQPDKYGAWVLISTVLIYLGNSNLGLNSAALTLISKSNNFHIKMKAYERTTKVLFANATIFIILFLLLNYVNKNWILLIGKFPSYLFDELYKTMFWAGILYLLNIPLSNISSALSGFQMLYIDKIFSLFNSISGFLALLIVIFLNGSLVTFAILNGLSSILLNIIKVFLFYWYVYKPQKVKNGEIQSVYENEVSYKSIIITGLRFFIIGVAAMIVWNTDNLVISHFLSVKDVTPYSITFKLYSLCFSIIFIVNGSMMPLFGKEIGNHNWDWLNKIYTAMLVIIAILGGLTWMGGILFFKDCIYLWVGKDGFGGLLTVFALGGYSYLLSIVNLNSGILSTFNFISENVWVSCMEAIINIILSIIFVQHFGIGGAALGTFLGSLFSVAWILPIIINKRTVGRIKINKSFIFKHLILIILPLIIASMLIEIYIMNIALRIVLSVLIILVYLIYSYKITPEDIKKYITQVVLETLLIKFNKNN